MLLETIAESLAVALATNSTDSTFATKSATTTSPTNNGVLDLRKGSDRVQNAMVLIPYADVSGSTYSVRLIGWRRVGNDPRNYLWIPTVLAEIACTSSTTQTGVAGSLVTSTFFFPEIISVTTGNSGVDITVISPGAASAQIGHATIDLKGCTKVEVLFAITANATTMNALYAFL